jgi:hypothetical protein
VLNAWLLRPLPAAHPEQLAVVARRAARISYPQLVDLRQQVDGFSDVVAYSTGAAGLSSGAESVARRGCDRQALQPSRRHGTLNYRRGRRRRWPVLVPLA